MSLNLEPNQTVTLTADERRPERVHVFDERSVIAVKAAYAARRPLLIRGEPGVGKTQLAEAVAHATGRPLVARVLDSRTESRDLLWEFDAVMRLAEAQLRIHPSHAGDDQDLAVRRFIKPGPIWFAFDWRGACEQAQIANAPIPDRKFAPDHDGGAVLLIDEIDKAESDVPNGLLEALGNGEFTPLGFDEQVTVTGQPPVVIITTNQERSLPDAFLRRCLVHSIRLPELPDLADHLVARGSAHFSGKASDELLQKAAVLLVEDRTRAMQESLQPLPGQAEYLDLVRAVVDMSSDPKEQQSLLDLVRDFAIRKHEYPAT